MSDYKAPLADIRFNLHHVFNVPVLWESLPGLEDADAEVAEAILEEIGKISEQVLGPMNREADEVGCRLENGDVVSPPGFKEAYQTYCEGGWGGLGGDPQYGGMGMPKSLVAAVEEMVQGACMSFGLAPMLTAGACLAIHAHASDVLKNQYLPNLYSGVWAGCMDLTEPHAGTDLGLLRTKAEPQPDGSYKITGSKIFITWGEHDMAENIIHLVLARLPDAPQGSKGISLFLVPKILVNDDGELGDRNALQCSALEKKMGVKASATCVMNFDGATGWIVGEPNKGLAAMFTMMNYERLTVGIQGIGAAEGAYQNAVIYAKERLQCRAATGIALPDKDADPIIVHPDVRRMLMTMRAFNEGSRAFYTYVATWLDIAKFSDDDEQRQRADSRVALLTPIAKAFITDVSFEAAVAGQQIFGGHGYIREWGQEQYVRDIRITQIYEGTNGIQAMDLIGRKTVMTQGALLNDFLDEIEAFISAAQHIAEFKTALTSVVSEAKRVTASVVSRSANNPDDAGAAANDYLHLLGYVAYAYLWAKQVDAARSASGLDVDFARAKIMTANYFYQKLLPQTSTLIARIESGSESLMALPERDF